jgi:hypothetical protein
MTGGTVAQLRQRRTCLTPAEFAALLVSDVSTVRVWVNSGLPSRVNGLPCLPWDRSAPPIVDFGRGRRAIYAAAIDPRVLDTPEKQTMLARFLASDRPPGWAQLDLNRPDPRRSLEVIAMGTGTHPLLRRDRGRGAHYRR